LRTITPSSGRNPLASGVHPGVEVVAETGDGREALELIEKHGPDVALLDIGMPSMNGLEVAKRVEKDFPGTRIVMLSMHADPSYVRQALRAARRAICSRAQRSPSCLWLSRP